ncbi:MAG: hypothetical protein LC746_13190 [Acidobacteria bacterium]|nr:hypothetical protein [Acidobacteriota bacterium]
MKRLFPVSLLLVALVSVASAQSPGGAAREELASLPDSQVVLVVNARRITNEALPAVMSPAKFNQMANDLLNQSNVDVRKIDFVVAGLRFTGGQAATAPDFGVVVRGGFNADALLSLVRIAGQGQFRDETHGGKTITIFTLDFEGGDKNPPGAQPADAAAAQPSAMKLPSEIAAVALGSDALLVGTPAYVTSAIDARSHEAPRVKDDLVELATRDADALVSLAGEMPPSVSKYLNAAGGADNPLVNDETRRLVDSIRVVQASLGMTAAQFGLQTVLRTDAPESARALSGLIATGVSLAQTQIRNGAAKRGGKLTADDQRVLTLLRTLTNTANDRDVALSVSVPQGAVAEMLREKKATTGAPASSKRPAARGGARRGRGVTRRRP